MIDDAIKRGFISSYDPKGALPYGFIRYLSQIKAMPSIDLTVNLGTRLYRLGFVGKVQSLFYLKDLSEPPTTDEVFREVDSSERLHLFSGILDGIDLEDARRYKLLRGDQTHDNTAV